MIYPLHALYYALLLLLFIGCGNTKKGKVTAEYLYRHHDEYFYTPPTPTPCPPPSYPWQKSLSGGYPTITKEFFRCNCNRHSLPLREGKEFVYPCLIDLLNYIQQQEKKKLVITCGHRCPTRNNAADPSAYNRASKHQLAAEVDFYIEDTTLTPQRLLELIHNYYEQKYPGKKEYITFERYQREGINVSTAPWFNKEIFIKYYLPHEGRDLDNQHPYPYVSIQVRFDEDLKKQVTYDAKAVENYLRDW